MWQRLLNAARERSGGQGATITGGLGSGAHKHIAPAQPRSPDKRVTFFGNGSGGTGGAPPFTGNDNAATGFSCSDDTGKGGTTTLGDNQGDRGSLEVFLQLWAECVGDDTCGGFIHTSGYVLGGDPSSGSSPSGGPSDGPDGGGGGGGDGVYGRDRYDDGDIAVAGMGTRTALGGSPRSPQHHSSSSLSSSQPISGSPPSLPWERLLLALLSRGVDASRMLTTHEYTLLKRELADWHRGQERGDVGREQGMSSADRLASAAAAAQVQSTGDRAAIGTAGLCPSTAAPSGAKSNGGKNKKSIDTAGYHGAGTVNNASRQVSFGRFEYPWVVVGDPPSSASRNVQANEAENQTMPAESATAAAAAAAGVAGTRVKKMAHLETPLDLRKVALEAHDVRVLYI